MSLFDDDFYSTKVTRRPQVLQSSGRMRAVRRLPVWAAPAAGVLLLTAVMAVLLSSGGEEPAQPAAAAVTAPGAGDGGASGGLEEARRLSESVVSVFAKVSPTVVSILGSKREDDGESGSSAQRGGGGMGLGSGVMFSRTGGKVQIITNNHVVEGFAQLDVVTSTGEKRRATLVGRDQITDLAVVEIDGSGIGQVAEFGDSDALRPGETAIAVGNPLGLGYAPSVTKGIISWPKRTIPVSLGGDGGDYDWEMEVIQTDAAINQGNSGGALVNLDGQVVGINTLKVADTGVEGVGFAIPINQVRQIAGTLMQEHKVKRPYLGVVTQDLQSFAAGTEELKLPKEVRRGVIVLEVTGPAKEAGLKSGDVIVELDGQGIDSTLALRKYVYGHKKIGEKLTVTYYRGGKKGSEQLTLAELEER